MKFRDHNGSDAFTHGKKLMSNIRLEHYNPTAWDNAEREELKKFKEMEVFEVRKIPRGVQTIPTLWVYTHKADDLKGGVYKARCVVQGSRQKEGVHFNKYRVLSPVVELLSIRTLTLIATEYNYPIHHLDIRLAYLHASLPKGEEIYVRPPPGHSTPKGTAWFLKKSVYGMKQAGFEWYTHLAMKLEKLGLTRNEIQVTIFTKSYKTGKQIVALYVDDLFLVAENEDVLSLFKAELSAIFDLKYFGQVSEYLGIEFQRTEDGYSMSQHKFLRGVLKQFEQHHITPRRTPSKVDHEGYGSSNNPKKDEFYETPIDVSGLLKGSMKTMYESGVGSISWAANNTRPDLSFTASSLASRSSNPTQNDFKKLIHCLGHILQSVDMKLVYSRRNKESVTGERKDGFTVETFYDASFASSSDVKLISGMAIYVNRNLVKWGSKKQKNITKSTAAAELVALSIAEDNTVNLVDLIKDLGYEVNQTYLYEDNQAVIGYCRTKSISHSRRMADIGMKLIRERLESEYYKLVYVNSLLNVAEMFTKALSPAMFNAQVEKLFWVVPKQEREEVNT